MIYFCEGIIILLEMHIEDKGVWMDVGSECH